LATSKTPIKKKICPEKRLSVIKIIKKKIQHKKFFNIKKIYGNLHVKNE